MYEVDGVGFAAPQVGILRRICVIDVGKVLLYLLIQRKLKNRTKSRLEGCLIPGICGEVERPEREW